MRTKPIAVLLTVALMLAILPAAACAAIAGVPTAFKAPTSLAVTDTAVSEFPYSTELTFSVDSAALKLIDPAQTDYDALGIDSTWHTAQVDWRLNDGPWHYSAEWDTEEGMLSDTTGYTDTGYLTGDATQTVYILDLRSSPGEETALQRELGAALIRGSAEDGADNRLDLANNTFSFRVRLMITYNVSADGSTGLVFSPWSETLVIGKGAVVTAAPTSLAAPVISNPVVGANPDGSPKITFTAVTPQQVLDASSYITSKDGQDIAAEHQININNTGWINADAGTWWLGAETRDISVPATYDDGKAVQVDSAYIQLRMRYTYAGGANVMALQSAWSNVISVNTPTWSKASAWATAELTKADGYGLIPTCLRGADLTGPITRQEFAALAVRLYEAMSGKAATPAAVNPFTDTTDPDTLRALDLGVVTGMTPTTFEPNTLINREQAATMLTRALTAANPGLVIDTDGAPKFTDDAKISSWARNSVLFMAKHDIIRGFTENNGSYYRPRNTTSAEVAAFYANATREQSILMAARSLESLR